MMIPHILGFVLYIVCNAAVLGISLVFYINLGNFEGVHSGYYFLMPM